MSTPEAKAARAAYMREWRKKNPEKWRAIQERYWAKKAAQLQEKKAEQKKNETVKNWIQNNLWPRKTINKTVSSYTLKHLLQNETGIYLTDTEFRKSMLECGWVPISYTENGYAYYPLSKKSPAFMKEKINLI